MVEEEIKTITGAGKQKPLACSLNLNNDGYHEFSGIRATATDGKEYTFKEGVTSVGESENGFIIVNEMFKISV